MKIEMRNIKIRDVFDGYVDQGDDGVFAFGGRLAIRPAYQREFVYDDEKARSVINTVVKGFPLNVMYWVKTGDDTYEVLDGQQRTLSIMRFLDHKLNVHLGDRWTYHDGLPDDIYESFLDYELMVYVCEGTESEKLDWFRVVNIAGERLTDQELRNSVYTGAWLTDAKAHFSKRTCVAKEIANKYITGDPNRQELLEKALRGICGAQGLKEITEYMAAHKSDKDADELWQYFQEVIAWVRRIFPKYYADMKGLDWCGLYNRYHANSYNSSEMATETKRLHEDEDVQKPKGIYEYLLARGTDPFAERHLSLRAFDKREKLAAYSRQEGVCPLCGQHFEFAQMEGDHIVPWSKGGHTEPTNCQMLCRDCNAKKSDKML